MKNSDKDEYVHSGYELAFDTKGEWSFDIDTARNAVIFGVHFS